MSSPDLLSKSPISATPVLTCAARPSAMAAATSRVFPNIDSYTTCAFMLLLLRPVTWAATTSSRLPSPAEQGRTSQSHEPAARGRRRLRLARLARDHQGPSSPFAGAAPP